MNARRMKLIGNRIGLEGARMISEVLETNTTLTSLNLSSEETKSKKRTRKKRTMNRK